MAGNLTLEMVIMVGMAGSSGCPMIYKSVLIR